MEYVSEQQEPEIVTKIAELVEHMSVDTVRFVFDKVIDRLTKMKYKKILNRDFEEEMRAFKQLTSSEQEEYLKCISSFIKEAQSW